MKSLCLSATFVLCTFATITFDSRLSAQEIRSIELVYCKPGTFSMGSPMTEAGREDNEHQRRVTISRGFWIAKTEVTQSQWRAVMNTEHWKRNHSVPTGPNYPASYTSWVDAMDFCRKLTAQEHVAGRLEADWEYTLPSEVQWEYACRAGTATAFSFGNDPSLHGDYTRRGKDKDGNPIFFVRYAFRVATLKPNPWGLYDMHGSLSEWCRGFYESEADDPLNPVKESQVRLRVIRGGAWDCLPPSCRSAIRSNGTPKTRESFIGFRVVKVLAE